MALSRQRDILPLPNFDSFDLSCLSHVSRCSKRRILRKHHSISWANDAIDAINTLGGFSSPTEIPISKLSSASKQSLSIIADAFTRVGKLVKPILSPEGAYAELLKNTSVYSDSRCDVKPYARDLVSWPPCGSKPACLIDGLEGADKDWLVGWQTHMLADNHDSHIHHHSVTHSNNNINFNNNNIHNNNSSTKSPTKAYCDPVLFRSHRNYAEFLHRLQDAGMIRWRVAHQEQSALGVFFVGKKNGSIRLIFDTRVLNKRFKPPPHTPLPSGAAFSSIQLGSPESNENQTKNQNENFCFGSDDDENQTKIKVENFVLV